MHTLDSKFIRIADFVDFFARSSCIWSTAYKRDNILAVGSQVKLQRHNYLQSWQQTFTRFCKCNKLISYYINCFCNKTRVLNTEKVPNINQLEQKQLCSSMQSQDIFLIQITFFFTKTVISLSICVCACVCDQYSNYDSLVK